MPDIVHNANRLLHKAYIERFPSEAAIYLEQLPDKVIAGVLTEQTVTTTIKIWERLSPIIAGKILLLIEPAMAYQILGHINPNHGAAILGTLTEAEQQHFLAHTDSGARFDLERAMAYPKESAGAMMGTKVVYYTAEMSVKEALSKLKAQRKPGVRVIFLVDGNRKLTGMLELQDLALASKDSRLGELMKPVKAYVESITSREEIVEIFEKNRVTELPVVDFEGRLIGIVRHYKLIEAAKEESSADLQTMFGVSKDERALSVASFAVKKRLPWLQINLATAFLAATVVGFFESTIAQYTALAILLPVVAGQSGNTGAQALAVTMRGLALREVWPRQWRSLVRKELGAGLWNGVAVALTTALGVYIWSQSPGLCLIISLSMVISMIIASISGAMIPLLLLKAGHDPATSSSIFLTTVTDVMGFFCFLGIATLMLGLL